MKLHIHFNNDGQICGLKDTLEVGKTAVIHLHEVPSECQICPNGHCHAPNLNVSRIDEETVFVTFENASAPQFCEIVDLPPHPFDMEHLRQNASNN